MTKTFSDIKSEGVKYEKPDNNDFEPDPKPDKVNHNTHTLPDKSLWYEERRYGESRDDVIEGNTHHSSQMITGLNVNYKSPTLHNKKI